MLFLVVAVEDYDLNGLYIVFLGLIVFEMNLSIILASWFSNTSTLGAFIAFDGSLLPMKYAPKMRTISMVLIRQLAGNSVNSVWEVLCLFVGFIIFLHPCRLVLDQWIRASLACLTLFTFLLALRRLHGYLLILGFSLALLGLMWAGLNALSIKIYSNELLRYVYDGQNGRPPACGLI